MIQGIEENTMGILYKYNSNIFGTISNQIFNPLPMTVSLQVWKRFQKLDPTREVPQFQPPFWVDDKLGIQTNDLGMIFLKKGSSLGGRVAEVTRTFQRHSAKSLDSGENFKP